MIAAAKKIGDQDKAYYLVMEEVFRPFPQQQSVREAIPLLTKIVMDKDPYFYKPRGLKLLAEVEGFFYVLDSMRRRLIFDGKPRTKISPIFTCDVRDVFAPRLDIAYFSPIDPKALKDKSAPQPVVYVLANNLVFNHNGESVRNNSIVYEMNVSDFYVFYERDYARGSRPKRQKKESKSLSGKLWGWLAPDPV
ncbi:MAG: hypothetical protein EOM37_01885 [Proteobacteria bacterium]|nr:hypothetical protein [Pseudomonadota bacterium]